MIFKTLLTSVAVSMAVASYAQAAIQDGTFAGRTYIIFNKTSLTH